MISRVGRPDRAERQQTEDDRHPLPEKKSDEDGTNAGFQQDR